MRDMAVALILLLSCSHESINTCNKTRSYWQGVISSQESQVMVITGRFQSQKECEVESMKFGKKHFADQTINWRCEFQTEIEECP